MFVFAAAPVAAPPLLPALVFAAELCVVTLSTVRIICLGRGQKGLASAIGFFEVSIWLFAIGQIMQNLSNLGCYLGFAGGFTAGNYLGMTLEEKMALGSVVVRVITRRDAGALVEGLRQAHFGVTSIDAQGATGPVQIVFTVVKRKQMAEVAGIVKRFDPRAFYSVDNLHSTAAGIFPLQRRRVTDGMALDLQRVA